MYVLLVFNTLFQPQTCCWMFDPICHSFRYKYFWFWWPRCHFWLSVSAIT